MAERKIKFNYFKVCCKDVGTGQIRDFDINYLISKVDGKELSELTEDYYQEKARLDKFWYCEKFNYWFLNFTRLRDTNIPNKAYVNKESEVIELAEDEFLSEECNAIYDCSLNVLMLQRNIHSLSVVGIEGYLNKILNDPSLIIILIPILNKDIFEKVDKAKCYRKITIGFANIKDKYVKVKDSSLSQIWEICNKYNGLKAEITISIGRGKKDTLDVNTVKETLKDMENNKQLISKASLTYATDDDKVNVVDLIEDVMHDYITVVLEKKTSLASQYVENLMYKQFNQRKGEIYEILEASNS